MTAIGSFYAAPGSGGNVLAFTNGTLTIGDGNLAGSLVYSNLGIVNNKLTGQTSAGNPTNYLSAEFSPGTGAMTVVFRPTGGHGNVAAKGVVLQDITGTNGAGWFLSTGQSGYFLLQQ